MRNRCYLALMGALLSACPTGGPAPDDPGPTPGDDPVVVDPVEPVEVPCADALVRDPIAGECVVARGEGVTPVDGYFRLSHPWIAQANGSNESIRYVMANAPAGGDGRLEAPFGDWETALEGLGDGANVTFVIGRGTLEGSASFAGLGRVTIVGNAASVTVLRADDEPVIDSQGADWVRIWGLALARTGEELGPALDFTDTERVHLTQVRIQASAGDGVLASGVGAEGFIMGYSSFDAVAGTALHAQEGLGWWTVDETVFQGPLGGDGISLVDFGGSQFRVFSSEFGGQIGGDGISLVDFGGSQFRVGETLFSGPIGGDGISLVDFGGSQFRSHDNVFQDVQGSALNSAGGQGTLMSQNDRMEGPIGRDGVTIAGFQGEAVTLEQIHIGSVDRIGVSGAESAGWWTIDGATFQGPVGFDGISLRGVGQAQARVKITGVEAEGIGRVGMRLLDGLGWWTVDETVFRGTGSMGVFAQGFDSHASLEFSRVMIDGAHGMGMFLDANSALVEIADGEISETVGQEQGGANNPGLVLGYGLLVADSAHLVISQSRFLRNVGTGILIDLRGWGSRRDRPDLSGEAVIRIEDVEVERSLDAAEAQPEAQAQHIPEDVEVTGMGDGRPLPGGPELEAQELPGPMEADEPGCGDGVLDPAVEACDDGNQDDRDACTALCKVNVCGDGLVNRGVEDCDDGNEVNHGDGCSNGCVAPDRIPFAGGVFNMGNVGVDAQPYNVSIRPYSLSRTEVTCQDYSDYLLETGAAFDVVKDGSIELDQVGSHYWNILPGGDWNGPCIVPDGWPHRAYNANSPAEEAYNGAVGTPVASLALDLDGSDQLPMDQTANGENRPFQYYYLVRRFYTGQQVAGAYLDIYHPNAAITVYVGGQLVHTTGMDGPACDSALTETSAEGSTRILLKQADLARLNHYYRYYQYVAVMLRPMNEEVQDLGFAMRFRAWRTGGGENPLPWMDGAQHRVSAEGQRLCGDFDYPLALNWDRAREYCRWYGGDLPTASQWEYAARNGGDDVSYPWGNRPRIDRRPAGEEVACDYANASFQEGQSTCENLGRRTPVCSFPLGHTDQGACDMIGNLAEWTLDGAGPVPPRGESGDGPQHTPRFWDPEAAFEIRGGSMVRARGAHAVFGESRRRDGGAEHLSFDYGFRCAWPAQ